VCTLCEPSDSLWQETKADFHCLWNIFLSSIFPPAQICTSAVAIEQGMRVYDVSSDKPTSKAAKSTKETIFSTHLLFPVGRHGLIWSLWYTHKTKFQCTVYLLVREERDIDLV